jgi:hypothetical protein
LIKWCWPELAQVDRQRKINFAYGLSLFLSHLFTFSSVLHYAAAGLFALRTADSVKCVQFILRHAKKLPIDTRDLKTSITLNEEGGRTALLYALGSSVPWKNEYEEMEDLVGFYPISNETEDSADNGKVTVADEDEAEAEQNAVSEDEPSSSSATELVEQEKRKAEEESNLLNGVIALLNHQATPYASDDHGSTALHYAAANGLTQVVQELLKRVPADIKDHHGWTPLLYAHVSEEFEMDVSDGCILALLTAKPDQLYELTSLMDDKKSKKVFRSLIHSLATKPQAYKFLNDFIKANPYKHYEVLPWISDIPGLLDLDNKKLLFYHILSQRKSYWHQNIHIQAERNDEFMSAHFALCNVMTATGIQISANFKGEIGGGPGVTREFWECVSLDMLKPEAGVFAPTGSSSHDDEMPMLLDEVGDETVTRTEIQGKVFFSEDTTTCSFNSSISGPSLAQTAGRLCGIALRNTILMPGVHSFSPLVFKLLTGEVPLGPIKLTYKDFEDWDEELFKSWDWMMKNHVTEDMDFTFSVDEVVGGKLVSRALPGHRATDVVTDRNKEEYVRLMVENKTKKILGKASGFAHGMSLHLSFCFVFTLQYA